MEILPNIKIKLAVSSQSFAPIDKSQQNYHEVHTATTELNAGWEIWKWTDLRMDKENCVGKFEFHYQTVPCEFRKELIISFQKYQVSVHWSFHCIISITDKVLLQRPLTGSFKFPWRWFLNILVQFSSPIWPHGVELTFPRLLKAREN